MTRTKLTPEDVEWLEQRIRASVEPVTPRPSFVADAKRALLDEAPGGGDDDPAWLAIAYGLLGLAALLIVLALLRRRR